MLGENIIPDERGIVTGVRVLPGEGHGPNRMEVTFQTSGTVLGAGFANTGTVVSTPMTDGVLAAEGYGITMTTDGGTLPWRFHGVGVPGPAGATRFRGIVLFQSAPAGLSRLVGTCVVVEAETDAERNISAKLWEWT